MCGDFSRAAYPGWWNIHTHKINHLNRLPNVRTAYGNGKSMIADWGRVGACQLEFDNNDLKVHRQISSDLAGSIYRSGCPRPILPVDYFHQNDEYDDPLIKYVAPQMPFPVINMYDDPIFGEQRSAAYACIRFLQQHRYNFIRLEEKKGIRRKKDSADADKLRQLFTFIDDFTREALASGCDPTQMREALTKLLAFTRDPTKEKESKGKPKTRKRKIEEPPSKALLPQFISSVLGIPTDSLSEAIIARNLGLEDNDDATEQVWDSDNPRLAAVLDPFVLVLAAREVNPDFLGSGCLRKVGKHASTMIWAPPALRRAVPTSLPRIYIAPLFQTSSCVVSNGQYAFFHAPEEFVGSGICEIDAVPLGYDTFFSLARTTNGGVFTTRVSFESCVGDALSIDDYIHSVLPSRRAYYRPSSLAICPWFGGNSGTTWALAGRTYDPSSHSTSHLAVVELFDGQSNRHTWSGRIPLSADGECLAHEIANCVAASSPDFVDAKMDDFEDVKASYPNTFLQQSLLDYCRQVVPRDGHEPLTPQQLLYQTELDMRLSHASTFVRVGFADAPGIISLTTPKRLMCVDTRIGSGSAREILNLSTAAGGSMYAGRSFSPHESIFHVQPQWYADTYALLATNYSALILDKRMPGHPVLHWTHALRGPLTYAEFLDLGGGNCDFPAETALVTASQLPCEISIIGVNFNRGVAIPPSLVGPTMVNGHLTDIIDCPLNNLPNGLMDPHLCDKRLVTGVVGATTCPIRSDEGESSVIGIRGLMLTSQGDLFSEDWYFNQHQADRSHSTTVANARAWCLGFRSTVPDPKKSEFRCTDVLSSLADMGGEGECKREAGRQLEVEDVVAESSRELGQVAYPKELFSDLMDLFEKENIPDGTSEAREEEEKGFGDFVDSVMADAAEKKRKTEGKKEKEE